MKHLFMLLFTGLAAALAPSCSRAPAPATPPAAAAALTTLRPEDRAQMEKVAAEIEKTKARLRKGEKITDPNMACMLYFYGALGSDTELLGLLRKTGTDIDAANTVSGETALQLAVLEGTMAAVGLLVGHGAKVNAQNRNGKSVLYDAVSGGNAELVRLLLDRGADPNLFESVYGTTPLLGAVSDNRLEIARLLLAHGARPDAGSHSTGATPLHFAVLKGYREIVDLLLANGADPNAKTKAGRTPLEVAVANHHDEIAALLKKHGAK